MKIITNLKQNDKVYLFFRKTKKLCIASVNNIITDENEIVFTLNSTKNKKFSILNKSKQSLFENEEIVVTASLLGLINYFMIEDQSLMALLDIFDKEIIE